MRLDDQSLKRKSLVSFLFAWIQTACNANDLLIWNYKFGFILILQVGGKTLTPHWYSLRCCLGAESPFFAREFVRRFIGHGWLHPKIEFQQKSHEEKRAQWGNGLNSLFNSNVLATHVVVRRESPKLGITTLHTKVTTSYVPWQVA